MTDEEVIARLEKIGECLEYFCENTSTRDESAAEYAFPIDYFEGKIKLEDMRLSDQMEIEAWGKLTEVLEALRARERPREPLFKGQYLSLHLETPESDTKDGPTPCYIYEEARKHYMDLTPEDHALLEKANGDPEEIQEILSQLRQC
jgi:hypothetical protein